MRQLEYAVFEVRLLLAQCCNVPNARLLHGNRARSQIRRAIGGTIASSVSGGKALIDEPTPEVERVHGRRIIESYRPVFTYHPSVALPHEGIPREVLVVARC